MQTFIGFPLSHQDRPAYLTIGNFDGVHRGHQALVSAMVQAAHDAGCLAGALTFDPHPRTVLRPDLVQAYLTNTDERAEILAALGLDCVIVLPFSAAIAGRTAVEFMRDLTDHLPLKELWIGPDFALGRGREGTAARLTEIGDELGYRVHVLPPFNWLGRPVRSSRIRALLQDEGDAAQAADLLGRPYQVIGPVTEGARRGRTMGFPTANLVPPASRLVPANGVYACWAWLGDAGHPAVANIGVRPTFDNSHRSIEAFLLDFPEGGDLYGETLGLSFVARLRGERRFPSIDALVEQIGADVAAARRNLGTPPNDADAAGTEPASQEDYWTELRHTADWAIRVTGGSQRQLFARTAAAMYQLQGADPSQAITLARAIRAEADNPGELLVAWLNRLLLGQEIGSELYTRFEFHAISPRGLSAVAYGYAGAPSHTAIKAVTYYDLEVAQMPGGWTAQVTFDV